MFPILLMQINNMLIIMCGSNRNIGKDVYNHIYIYYCYLRFIMISLPYYAVTRGKCRTTIQFLFFNFIQHFFTI